MIRRMSQKCISLLAPPSADENRLAICASGLELAVFTFLSTSCLFLIGFLSGHLLDTVLIVSVFYTLQTAGGGYHADSHIKCLMTMISGLAVSLALLPGISCSGAKCILLLYLWSRPLSLHKNKEHLRYAKKQARPEFKALYCDIRTCLSGFELPVFVLCRCGSRHCGRCGVPGGGDHKDSYKHIVLLICKPSSGLRGSLTISTSDFNSSERVSRRPQIWIREVGFSANSTRKSTSLSSSAVPSA